jgi:hypothetical protein
VLISIAHRGEKKMKKLLALALTLSLGTFVGCDTKKKPAAAPADGAAAPADGAAAPADGAAAPADNK